MTADRPRDAILIAAAQAGAALEDLAGLADEIYARSLPGTPTTAPQMTASRTGRCGWRPPSTARG